jgi:hypothetical protein
VTPVDWSPEQKQGYLLALWDEVLTGIDAIWARAVAARAADASALRLSRDGAIGWRRSSGTPPRHSGCDRGRSA